MATRYWVPGGITTNWSDVTNWRTTSGGTILPASVPGSSDAAVLDANSGTGSVTVDSNITIQALTCTGFTGTLAFGTNTISLNSTATVFSGSTTMTVTGTPLIILTNSSATGRTISPTTATEANAISFNVTAGTGNITLTSNGAFKNVNLTGFAGNIATSNPDIYGNLTIPSGVTATATGTFNFKATSGVKTITTSGVVLDRPFTFNGVGGTWRLQDALTLGSSRTLTLTAGTLDLNNYTLTTGFFNSNNSNVRSILFGTGSVVLTLGGTAWNTTDATNLTTDATGTISMNSASSKTFAGGSRTWGKLENSGAGSLTITGTNTFMELFNSVAPTTFIFPAGVTTSAYLYTFSGNGPSNLLSLRSSSPGTQYTLAKL